MEERYINPNGVHAIGSLQQEETVLALFIANSKQVSWNNAITEAREILSEADLNLPHTAYTQSLPGVPEVLFRLHEEGVPLAVVTQDRYERALETLDYLGLKDVISAIITPSDVQHSKPAPDMMILTAKKLGVDVSRLAMVGDSVVDVEMASAAGAIPIYFSQDNNHPEYIRKLSKTTISSISEIGLGV
jgi:phosphoglycolate phosphatase